MVVGIWRRLPFGVPLGSASPFSLDSSDANGDEEDHALLYPSAADAQRRGTCPLPIGVHDVPSVFILYFTTHKFTRARNHPQHALSHSSLLTRRGGDLGDDGLQH